MSSEKERRHVLVHRPNPVISATVQTGVECARVPGMAAGAGDPEQQDTGPWFKELTAS